MKKSIDVLLVLAAGAFVAWQNRVSLLVWGIPLVSAVSQPIGPNIPVQWPAGPAAAGQASKERPPNINFILADDMGFNDISLYNGGAADGSVQTPDIDAIARQGCVV